MELKPDFAFTPLPSIARPLRFSIAGPTDTPLGFLEGLTGTWTGRGFNVIWRPFHGGPPNQDRFLELNLTEETLRFEEIPGPIPNRGLLQADINMFGLFCKRSPMRTSKMPMASPRDFTLSPASGRRCRKPSIRKRYLPSFAWQRSRTEPAFSRRASRVRA